MKKYVRFLFSWYFISLQGFSLSKNTPVITLRMIAFLCFLCPNLRFQIPCDKWLNSNNALKNPHILVSYIIWLQIQGIVLRFSRATVIIDIQEIYEFWKISSSTGPVGSGFKNTLTASLPRGKTPPQECPDMMLSNLLERLLCYWNFGECGVSFYCHHSRVHSYLEWLHLIESYL